MLMTISFFLLYAPFRFQNHIFNYKGDIKGFIFLFCLIYLPVEKEPDIERIRLFTAGAV